MTFSDAPTGPNVSEDLRVVSLPERECSACFRTIGRRRHRVAIAASWRGVTDFLCPECWHVICQWAVRFANEQLELGLDDW